MKTVVHFLIGAGTVVVPGLISLLASPAAQNFLAHHPADAIYVPIVSGLLAAFYDKLKNRKA